MLVSRWRKPHKHLVARPDPPPILIPHVRLRRRLLVMQVPQCDGWPLEEQLPGLLVLGDWLALQIHNLGARPGEQRPRGPDKDVVLLRAAHARRGLCHAIALADVPVRIDLHDLVHRLAAEGRSAGVEEAEG